LIKVIDWNEEEREKYSQPFSVDFSRLSTYFQTIPKAGLQHFNRILFDSIDY
jgi:hypothetical protein